MEVSRVNKNYICIWINKLLTIAGRVGTEERWYQVHDKAQPSDCGANLVYQRVGNYIMLHFMQNRLGVRFACYESYCV